MDAPVVAPRKRLFLIHGPTPIERRPALDELIGAVVWIKRDDATGGAEAGNKVRKLEFLLADAVAREAEVIITCGVAHETWAFAVCDDREYFETTIARIAAEARAYDSSLPPLTLLEPGAAASRVIAPDGSARLIVDDQAKGPSYAVMDENQKQFLVNVARKTGLVLDPVYTGKAMWGLARAVERGDIDRDARVLFIHTGGLPGLLAQGEELRAALD